MNLNRRSLIAGGMALAGASALPAWAAPETAKTPLHLVHPDLRDIVPMMEQFGASLPELNRANLKQARKPIPFINMEPLATVPYEQRSVPVGRGHPDVALHVINARAGTSRPAILHTHGGGFVMGSAKDAVRQMQELAAKLDCAIVSVDYRLAPETTYAGSIEDNYAGLKWLHANAAALGVDPARIAVMGESAGGGHAALLAITARDRGEVPVCYQCLIYPMLDDRTGSSRKMPDTVGTLIWTEAKNRFGWESFLGMAPGGAKVPKAAVPARRAKMAGLPPAFIAVGTLDLFCDEDIEYARRLNAAQVPVELHVVPGAFHGFDGIALLAKKPLGTWFEEVKLTALKRGLGLPA